MANSLICEILEKKILQMWRRAKVIQIPKEKLTFNLNETHNTDLGYDNVELHSKKWKIKWSRIHAFQCAYIEYLFTYKRN